MSRTTVSAEILRRACARFATGVAIVTVRDSNGKPQGLTVNSFASVSANPPLILVCIDRTCSLLPEFQRSEYFAVNFLRDSQKQLSDRFARFTGDRFAELDWQPGNTGAPVLSGVLGVLECKRWRMSETGDHDVLIGEVIGAEAHPGDPLLYFGSGYRRLSD